MKTVLCITVGLFVFQDAFCMTDEVTQALHAIATGNKSEVIQLIKGMNINAVGQDECSLLMTAAWHGQTAIAQYLLDQGAAIEQEDAHYRTALIHGADKGHQGVVKLLLERGADINKVDEQSCWKPIDYAAARDRIEVVKIMLALKGDFINKEDRQKASKKTKNHEIKKLLLQE